MKTTGQRLVLASASPRRRTLLAQMGLDFEVRAPDLEEPDLADAGLPPAEVARELARLKARRVADSLSAGWVLGADTVVVLGERVIGKPADEPEAIAILSTLRNTRHSVITGVCFIDAGTGRELVDHDETFIKMANMSDQEIRDYVRSGESMGKAGAYAIQETADRYVEEVTGSFSNVVGLPTELVAKMLAELSG